MAVREEGISKGLGKAVLDRLAATERARANSDDDGEHESEDDPANPRERFKSASGGTVGQRTSVVRDGSSTGEPEDPSNEDPDTVTSDRSKDTADTSEKESSLYLDKGKSISVSQCARESISEGNSSQTGPCRV